MKPTIDMTISPYDRSTSPREPGLVNLSYKPKQRWVASRYNARTLCEDGRLILWNTLSGAISAFQPADAEAVIDHLRADVVRDPLDKVGRYLSRRGFLVHDRLNELDLFRYKYAQGQWRTDMLQFILLASEDCNFRCVYCYEKFERGTMDEPTRQGLRALTLRRAPFIKDLSVSWFGGEPLYGWDAVQELNPFFVSVAAEHGIAYRQQMTTNAYLLTEERATKLLEWGCRQYQITVDGLPAEHDCKRVGRDGSPTYAVILDNLRSMRDRRHEHFTIELRVNFDRDNFAKLGPFLEALSNDFAGDPRFVMRFRAVGKWGGANDDQLAVCGVDTRSYMRELQSKAEQVNLRQEAGLSELAAPGSQVCYAARPYNFVVGATGRLMKCTVALYNLEENIVGQLHPDGTMDLHDEHMSRWVNPHWETDTHCQSCHLLPGCQGAACPLSRVTIGERTCTSVKANLKREMRATLARSRGGAAPAEEALAGAAS